jgi:hypothetical protein
MLLSDGQGLKHSYSDPVRLTAARNDFKIDLKGLLTILMKFVFKCIYDCVSMVPACD